MFRAGFFQFRPHFGEVRKNLETVLESLAGVEADLMVLPELPFTGYNFRNRRELAGLAEDPSRSETVDALASLCRRKSLYLVTGFAEKAGDRIFNSALLIRPRGPVRIYRKLHLFFNEKKIFDPGDLPLQTHTVRGVRIGMMICFDWVIPEVARTLALERADLLCHPSNLVLDYCQKSMRTRCLENGVFAITANRFGLEKRPHGSLKFTGGSTIIGPRSEILAQAPAQRRRIEIAGIDPKLARNKFLTRHNHLLKDRRPEFYA